MNYTENYHLPQWEKEDRIMMDDFNRMCADIESGMLAGQADCKERTLDGLFRAAWNHYQLAAAGTAMPRQAGVFRQKFDGSTPLGSSGLMQKDGYAWMTWDGEGFTTEEFLAGLHVDSLLSVHTSNPSASKPLILSFTAKGAGYLERIDTSLSYGIVGNGNSTYILSVTDLTTGLAVSGASFTQSTRVNSAYSYLTIYPNITLQTGHKYQIKLVVDQALQAAHLNANEVMSVGVTSYHAVSATFSHQFIESEASAGGLFFVRYDLVGTGSTLSLQWNGREVQPFRVRTITDEKGRRVQEAEYRWKGAAPAESTAELWLSCARKEEVSLYEWGGILI